MPGGGGGARCGCGGREGAPFGGATAGEELGGAPGAGCEK